MTDARTFAGRHVFIAGASSGINLGIAHGFAAAGAKITVLSRSADKIAAAAAEIGNDALGLSCDVRDFPGLEAAFAQGSAKHGPIDVLVSGAAGNFLAPAHAMSANAFKTVVDIDLLGTFNVFRAGFEHLVKPGASLIAITAGQAVHPMAYQAHVCAAKAGVNMVVKCLALEWGPAGVRVNGISPGPIGGTEGMARLAADSGREAAIKGRLALRDYGTKQDIAGAAMFLSGPAAKYVTGAILNVDGGNDLGDASADVFAGAR